MGEEGDHELDHETSSADGWLRPSTHAFKALSGDRLVTQSARKFSAEAKRFEDLHRKFKRWRCPKTDRKGFSGIRTIDQDLGVNRNATEANDNHRGSDVP
jgi:hypothetical protein